MNTSTLTPPLKQVHLAIIGHGSVGGARNGFDLVSSNKKSNTTSWRLYQELRETLRATGRSYRYETNVGAGLPLIDNIRLLHLAGERITRIHGLFSGSLSYIFNTLGEQPDPREDLSGEDVAHKVLILARELDVPAELSDVQWENPIPPLRTLTPAEFDQHFDQFEAAINKQRALCSPDEVLRYVGEVLWDDNRNQATLSAGLRRVPRNSPLGQVRGADSCFAIYTQNYGAQPIVIQGAGAGAVVTARGVFGDILRLADTPLTPPPIKNTPEGLCQNFGSQVKQLLRLVIKLFSETLHP